MLVSVNLYSHFIIQCTNIIIIIISEASNRIALSAPFVYSAPHWIRAWASPNKRVAIEKQAHTIYGQDKVSRFSLLSYRRVHTPFANLLN